MYSLVLVLALSVISCQWFSVCIFTVFEGSFTNSRSDFFLLLATTLISHFVHPHTMMPVPKVPAVTVKDERLSVNELKSGHRGHMHVLSCSSSMKLLSTGHSYKHHHWLEFNLCKCLVSDKNNDMSLWMVNVVWSLSWPFLSFLAYSDSMSLLWKGSFTNSRSDFLQLLYFTWCHFHIMLLVLWAQVVKYRGYCQQSLSQVTLVTCINISVTFAHLQWSYHLRGIVS